MLNKTYFTSFVTARNKASEAHVDNALETYGLLLFYTSVSDSRKTYGVPGAKFGTKLCTGKTKQNPQFWDAADSKRLQMY